MESSTYLVNHVAGCRIAQFSILVVCAFFVSLCGCGPTNDSISPPPYNNYSRASLASEGVRDELLLLEPMQVYVVSAGEMGRLAEERGYRFELRSELGSCGHIEFTDSRPWYTGGVELVAGLDSNHLGSDCEFALFSGKSLAPGWSFARFSSYSSGTSFRLVTGADVAWVPEHDFSENCQQNGICGSNAAWTWQIIKKPEMGSSALATVVRLTAISGYQGRLAIKRIHLIGPRDDDWRSAFK